MAHVLVVEDHPDVRELLREELAAAGHRVTTAQDGRAARAAIADAPDLVLLDLMLPWVSGATLLEEIRAVGDLPVIVVSARDAVWTKVEMLRLGADDYVTKPFDVTEVTARVEALLRRAQHADATPQPLAHGPLRVDPARAEASVADEPLSLTSTELGILETLLRDPHQVHSRAQLWESVWGESWTGEDGIVKTHVSNLRTKLRSAAPEHDPIETVWGLGYRLRRVED